MLRPVYVSHIAAQYGLTEKIVLNVLETLLVSHRLKGTITGAKEKALYIPEIYSRIQTEYVDSFFNQNSYIEYRQLGKFVHIISDIV